MLAARPFFALAAWQGQCWRQDLNRLSIDLGGRACVRAYCPGGDRVCWGGGLVAIGSRFFSEEEEEEGEEGALVIPQIGRSAKVSAVVNGRSALSLVCPRLGIGSQRGDQTVRFSVVCGFCSACGNIASGLIVARSLGECIGYIYRALCVCVCVLILERSRSQALICVQLWTFGARPICPCADRSPARCVLIALLRLFSFSRPPQSYRFVARSCLLACLPPCPKVLACP